ncbi:MAG: hypothetical protein N4A36_00675 [Candidatus Gracilibacteria bacterium]|jgi:hypothetical protein|nr:hypothetical protein [Candidatus Gracilibacteria bacterium]
MKNNTPVGTDKTPPKKSTFVSVLQWIFVLGIGLPMTLAFISGFTEDETASPKEVITTSEDKVQPVEYTIIKSEDESHKALGNKLLSQYSAQELNNLPIDKKFGYSIIVSPQIKEKEVVPTIDKIIKDLTSKDGDLDEITLFLYSDESIAKNGLYDVARATWAPYGKLGNMTPEIARSNDRSSYKTTYDIKENLETYLAKRGESEEKFVLTEEQRRTFFKEVGKAERRASDEANAKYPINNWEDKAELTRNMDYLYQLEEKYRAEVFKKYGITDNQYTEIITEGMEENWEIGF